MIKEMLYKLSGIRPLQNKEIKQEKSTNIYDNAILSFNFILDKEGKLFIDGNWIEQSEYMEEIIAKFLFMLNKGEIRPYVFNYLVNIKNINKDIKYQKFIDNIMIKWGKMIEKEDEESNLPIVQPSKAFIFNQIKGTQNNHIEEEGDE